MIRAVLVALSALFLVLAPPQSAAQAPHALVPWVQGLEAAKAPGDEAMEAVRRIVQAFHAQTTPRGRGDVVLASGPALATALAQVREARAAVQAYQPFVSGNPQLDAQANAAQSAVRTNIDAIESMILGLQSIRAAGERGDAAGVRRAGEQLLPLPAIMLRGSASSFRLMALHLPEADSQHHLLRARAAFYEAAALIGDVLRPLDQAALSENLAEGLRWVESGRAALADERAGVNALPRSYRSTYSQLIETGAQGLAVTERVITTLRDDCASLAAGASPEERLTCPRAAAVLDAENNVLAVRAGELGQQVLQQQ